MLKSKADDPLARFHERQQARKRQQALKNLARAQRVNRAVKRARDKQNQKLVKK